MRIVHKEVLDVRVQLHAAQAPFLYSNRFCYHICFGHAGMDGTKPNKFRMDFAIFCDKTVDACHLLRGSSDRADKVMANAKTPAVFQ